MLPAGSVTDTITVGNTGGAGGTLDWRLVGPVTPGPDRSCANVDWSTAETFDSGSIDVTGEGGHTTPPSTPTDPGCYSYVTITVEAVPLGAGAVVKHAHVTTPDRNTAPRRDVFAAVPTRVTVPLKLTKTASARTINAGGTVSYRIAVANPTKVTARSPQICDKLPVGLALVAASVKTRLHNGSLCWTIASISPHAHRAYTMTLRALPGASGTRVNSVTLSGPAVAVRHAHGSVRILSAARVAPPVTG